jgi:cytosine/adenosine deaminase-related metal-dependent hydrolase
MIVLRAGTVLTVDPARRVLSDAAVVVDGGRITAIGDGADLVAAHPDAEVISAPDGILLPGLIDVHGHAGHSLVRTLGGDDLGAWMEACERIYLHGSTEDFWYADARLTAVERLRFGTTTGLSMLGGAGDTIRSDDARYGVAHVRGTRESGIRDVVVVGPGAPPFPKPTTDAVSGAPVESSFEDQLATLRTLVEEHHDGAMVLVAATFPTLSLDDLRDASWDELLACARAVADLSAQAGLLVVQDGHRADTVVATDRLGLLSDRSLLSHSVDLGDQEIGLLAERGASIAHNPSAIYSQFGRCPVPELLDAGVTVALGSDATAPDRSADMFRHMFQMTRYHRADRRDPALFPPGRVLEMATIDAARALGIDDLVGSIEVGKAADLVLVDADRPHLAPLSHPVHQLVYHATGADVDTVLVGGEVVVRDGRVTSVDVDEVMADGRREQALALERTGLERLLRDRPGTWGFTRYPDGPGLDL